jgi:hypothetical protein
VPLLDHFAPPLAPTRKWSSLHSAWINAIVGQLNGSLLPENYFAAPNVTMGGVEIDVATTRNGAPGHEGEGDGPRTAGWTPPQPAITVPIDFTAVREFEVRVFYGPGDPALVGVVEMVSPANKDRPSERRAFAAKCASYLHQRVSLIVVDIVTERRADLHAELVHLLDLAAPAEWASPTGLSAIGYRLAADNGEPRLQLWPAPLAVGSPLPTLPLWLGDDGPVPVDLEASYMAACRGLRIRVG